MSAVTSPSFSFARIGAMVRRHWYLLRSSWPRLLELIYWPLVQMVMWGFQQSFMAKETGALAMAAGTFLAAVLLWDILFRGQLGFSFSFLEEMWSRNLANLMISPPIVCWTAQRSDPTSLVPRVFVTVMTVPGPRVALSVCADDGAVSGRSSSAQAPSATMLATIAAVAANASGRRPARELNECMFVCR